jgi:translocator protein
MTGEQTNANRAGLLAFVAAAPVIGAAVLGSLASEPAINGFYASLAKPWFTPPNWLFGPAWTTLYILMAYAFWRVLVLPAKTHGRDGAVRAFFIQIALNATWSAVFFGLRSLIGGLVTVVALWCAILLTIVRFRRLDKSAAYCLTPYLAWTTFAAALNAGVWILNR